MSTSIYFKEYYGKEDQAKTLILFHDIGGGHDTFKSLIPLLTEVGLNVVVFDYLGHGLSAGTRGHFDNTKVVKSFLEELHRCSLLAQGSEIYTLSINQGALVALYYATLFDNVKGNIFLNPKLRTELTEGLKGQLITSIPFVSPKLQLQLKKQSNDLTANGFITKRTYDVLQKIIKNVQLEVYFMNCRNLIFSSHRDSMIFETLMSEYRDEVEVADFNSIKTIKKEDIIFKETYNWIYEN